MTRQNGHQVQQMFGGDWTIEKLEILGDYLDAYTSVFLNYPGITLTFVDGFAGTGTVKLKSGRYKDLCIPGSARRAMDIENRPFDRILLIESNSRKAEMLSNIPDPLMGLSDPSHDRKTVLRADANIAVQDYCNNMEGHERAVIFLDPYGMQVNWSTVAAIADTGYCDMFLLFPIPHRPMTRADRPDPSSRRGQRLTAFFGDQWWYTEPYELAGQGTLALGEEDRSTSREQYQRSSGVDQIVGLYERKLRQAFSRGKVTQVRRRFRNTKSAPMFEYFFAASNPRGAKIADRIAMHLMSQATQPPLKYRPRSC